MFLRSLDATITDSRSVFFCFEAPRFHCSYRGQQRYSDPAGTYVVCDSPPCSLIGGIDYIPFVSPVRLVTLHTVSFDFPTFGYQDSDLECLIFKRMLVTCELPDPLPVLEITVDEERC